MRKPIAIVELLSVPLLCMFLSACGMDGTSYSNRIAGNGHDVLYSKAIAKDGVARFECKASSSGTCYYTIFPEACAGKADCALVPLQRFTVKTGQTRRIAGLDRFRVCVAIDARPLRADCEPAAQVATR